MHCCCTLSINLVSEMKRSKALIITVTLDMSRNTHFDMHECVLLIYGDSTVITLH